MIYLVLFLLAGCSINKPAVVIEQPMEYPSFWYKMDEKAQHRYLGIILGTIKDETAETFSSKWDARL